MGRKAVERDLRHGADHDQFAAAMMKCEFGSADCSHHGYCLLDGACFASPGHLVAARMIAKLIPSADADGKHFSYLRKCVELLRAGSVCLDHPNEPEW
jgi:hypothetical protein